MKATRYLCVSGSIFGIVGIGHLIRSLLGVSIFVERWEVPMWISWLGCTLALALCIWAFTEARKTK